MPCTLPSLVYWTDNNHDCLFCTYISSSIKLLRAPGLGVKTCILGFGKQVLGSILTSFSKVYMAYSIAVILGLVWIESDIQHGSSLQAGQGYS